MSQTPLERHDKAQLGFWLYLMTDLMLFASLFATFMVLRNGISDGPSGRDIFEPSYALLLTVTLLVSSFTCGLALLAMRYQKKTLGLGFLAATVLLGLVFLVLEVREFADFVHEGHTWEVSAFLSAFFTLVGAHGLHIFIGIIWASVVGGLIYTKGITSHSLRKFSLFALFWHFLDIVWIFIFTIVYLFGVSL